MNEAHVQELKYKLDDIVVAKGASPLVAGLLKTLLNGIAKKLSEQGKTATFETQKNGVSGFCRPKKAFGWFDLRQNYISILLFSGHSSIPGLAKANWVNKGDNLGCERVRVADESHVKEAIEMACKAFDIAERF